jgi:uncharacterized membrane protein
MKKNSNNFGEYVFLLLGITAVLFLVLISILLAAGDLTNSGFFGICGPFGKMGSLLFHLVVAGIVVCPVIAFGITRRKVKGTDYESVNLFDNRTPVIDWVNREAH